MWEFLFEFGRRQYSDRPEFFNLQKMLVARNDDIRLALKGAIEKFVICRIFRHDLEPMGRLNDLRAAD